METIETLSFALKVDIRKDTEDTRAFRFDWYASTGEESDEFFDTAEEAKADALRQFS